MAEHLQTNASNGEWTTIIRPRTGWFDIDLQELWHYRDLVVLFVKLQLCRAVQADHSGSGMGASQPAADQRFVQRGVRRHRGPFHRRYSLFPVLHGRQYRLDFLCQLINNTANTFVANSQVFGKVYFPRLTMPISQALTSLINFLIQAAMFVLFWIYFWATGSDIHLTAWMWAVPLVLIQTMLLGLGVGIIVSSLTTKYRDLAIAVSFGVQLWMYVSPVVYPLSTLGESRASPF